MKQNSCKRVLHVVSAMHRGGAETMIMNIYRNIDRNKVQFDFVVHSDVKGHFDDEIKSLGGRIIKCSSLGQVGTIRYIKELSSIIKENGPFHAVHAHTDFQTGFVALAAKKAGIKKRICHSHNTQWKATSKIIDNMMLYCFKKIIKRYGTDFCACGEDAAKFLFNKKFLEKGNVTLIANGIDIEKFNVQNQENISEILGIEINKNTTIIGNIARFCEQKNHKFIIEIAKYMVNKKMEFVILLIGEGPLSKDIEKLVKVNNLEKYIKFLGVRDDISDIMNLFDIFLLPSLYEGLPLVLVEAQASGTVSVVSDTITNEVDFELNMIKYCNLDNIHEWVNEIINYNNNDIPIFEERYNKLKIRGYDVKENINKIMKLYNVVE